MKAASTDETTHKTQANVIAAVILLVTTAVFTEVFIVKLGLCVVFVLMALVKSVIELLVTSQSYCLHLSQS